MEDSWDFCARDHDYQYSFLSFFGYMAAKKVADGYWEVMAKKGKPLNPYSMAFAQGVAVAETDERNATSPRTPTTSPIAISASLRAFADAPGYRSLNSIRAAMKAGLPAAFEAPLQMEKYHQAGDHHRRNSPRQCGQGYERR